MTRVPCVLLLCVCMSIRSYGCEPSLAHLPPSSRADTTASSRQPTPVRPSGTGCTETDGEGGTVPPRTAARLRVRMLPYLAARLSQVCDEFGDGTYLRPVGLLRYPIHPNMHTGTLHSMTTTHQRFARTQLRDKTFTLSFTRTQTQTHKPSELRPSPRFL